MARFYFYTLCKCITVKFVIPKFEIQISLLRPSTEWPLGCLTSQPSPGIFIKLERRLDRGAPAWTRAELSCKAGSWLDIAINIPLYRICLFWSHPGGAERPSKPIYNSLMKTLFPPQPWCLAWPHKQH